jgi:PAS domain S-box-containing protein
VLANSAVILITLVILASALLSSLVDRRFSAQAKELELSEQRYQHLFESNPHPTFVFDLQTLVFLAVNQAAISKYGFSQEEFQARKITELHSPEELDRLLETAQSEASSESQHRHRDGTAFDVELSLRTITWAGNPAGLLLASDITERKRNEQMETDRRNFLETITQNQPLEESLDQLVHILESQLPGAFCSILLLRPSKFCHVAASSFSKEVSAGLEGFRLEEIASTLAGNPHGQNPNGQEIALVEDFPASCPDRELGGWARALSLKSCWSAPVVDARGESLGVIVAFFRDPRQLTTQGRNRLQMAAGMASSPLNIAA